MYWDLPPRMFRTVADGNDIGVCVEELFEPRLPATEYVGSVLALEDTPTGVDGESYVVVPAGGPSERLTIEVRVGGGSWADGATAFPVGGVVGTAQTVDVRATAAAWGDTDNEVVWMALLVTSSGEAGWLS